MIDLRTLQEILRQNGFSDIGPATYAGVSLSVTAKKRYMLAVHLLLIAQIPVLDARQSIDLKENFQHLHEEFKGNLIKNHTPFALCLVTDSIEDTMYLDVLLSYSGGSIIVGKQFWSTIFVFDLATKTLYGNPPALPIPGHQFAADINTVMKNAALHSTAKRHSQSVVDPWRAFQGAEGNVNDGRGEGRQPNSPTLTPAAAGASAPKVFPPKDPSSGEKPVELEKVPSPSPEQPVVAYVQCPDCGTRLHAGARRCGNCGSVITQAAGLQGKPRSAEPSVPATPVAPQACQQCSNSLPPDALFCPYCGNRLV